MSRFVRSRPSDFGTQRAQCGHVEFVHIQCAEPFLQLRWTDASASVCSSGKGASDQRDPRRLPRGQVLEGRKAMVDAHEARNGRMGRSAQRHLFPPRAALQVAQDFQHAL